MVHDTYFQIDPRSVGVLVAIMTAGALAGIWVHVFWPEFARKVARFATGMAIAVTVGLFATQFWPSWHGFLGLVSVASVFTQSYVASVMFLHVRGNFMSKLCLASSAIFVLPAVLIGMLTSVLGPSNAANVYFEETNNRFFTLHCIFAPVSMIALSFIGWYVLRPAAPTESNTSRNQPTKRADDGNPYQSPGQT